MLTPTKFSLSLILATCLAGSAIAAPPALDPEAEILIDKIEDKLSDHTVDIAKSTARLKRKIEKNQAKSSGNATDDIEVMMDVMEEAFAEDGLFRDLAAMFVDLAEDLDVDTDGGTTTLSFDGAKIGQIERKKSRDSEDSFSISGLGRNLSVDRETIVKDGKSKTRIVIDMDGEDEIDITLPQID